MGTDIIKAICNLNDFKPEQVHLSSSPHFTTIIGYHLGLGNKPRCPREQFIVVHPPEFNPDEYLARCRGGNKTLIKAERNRLLLTERPSELVSSGQLSLLAFAGF